MFKYQTKVQVKFHNKVTITKYSKQLRKGLRKIYLGRSAPVCMWDAFWSCKLQYWVARQKTLSIVLKPSQNKTAETFSSCTVFESFFTACSKEKDSKNGAARKIFGPSYFDLILHIYHYPDKLEKNRSKKTDRKNQA